MYKVIFGSVKYMLPNTGALHPKSLNPSYFVLSELLLKLRIASSS